MPEHFISTQDHSIETLERILARAADLKRSRKEPPQILKGRTVGLVFFNPSLRTRVSMQAAVQALGGQAVSLEAGRDIWPMEWADGVVMDREAVEHVKDAVKVLSRYVSALGVRSFPEGKDWNEDRLDPVMRAFVRHAEVPVVNLESALWHPCQAMADLLTMRERLGDLRGRKAILAWAWHPKSLPMAVPNSFAAAATRFGMDLTIACPEGFDLAPEVEAALRANADASRGSLRVSRDAREAAEGAEVIYAKSWGSLAFYGRASESRAAKERLRHWKVTSDLMRLTRGGIFMHCLPVRRNVVADDEVLDSAASAIYDQAENRLWAQIAVLQELLA